MLAEPGVARTGFSSRPFGSCFHRYAEAIGQILPTEPDPVLGVCHGRYSTAPLQTQVKGRLRQEPRPCNRFRCAALLAKPI